MTQLQVYTGTGDGRVYATAVATWSTARDATGSTVSTTSINNFPGATLSAGNYTIRRCLMMFDTSSIPDNAVITSASLRITRYSVSGIGNDFVVGWTSNTSLTNSSYDKANWALSDTIGHTNYAALFPMSEFVANGTQVNKSLDLNYIDINKSGTTYIGAVDLADFNNSAPAGVDILGIGAGDNVDDAYKPQLTVTYAEVCGPWDFEFDVISGIETTATARIQKAFTKTQTARATVDDWDLVGTVSGNTYTYSDTTANASTNYQYRIRAVTNGIPSTLITSTRNIEFIRTTAVSRIVNVSTKTQPACSRISKVFTKTQPAGAYVIKLFTKTQPATAKIVAKPLNGLVLAINF
ncbi:hypothetical protein HGB25_00250 [Candidatus Saccharibacteria bacterium]|nr:hypothetical protein [Candidatus Saccharibacteria bacterium]